jgi:short-subunit dehydrogenase
MMNKTITALQRRHNEAMLPYMIHGLIEDMEQIFSRTNHQLILLVASQEELDLVAADFKDIPFMDIKLLPGNVFEPYYTEQVYKNLKYASTFHPNYWEANMEEELCAFSNNAEALESLSRLYTQHVYETFKRNKLELTFVVSHPESPLMAVYHGTKVMVYNFSD